MKTIKCDKCGHEMINNSHGPYIDFVCTHCGYGWSAFDSDKGEKHKAKYSRKVFIAPSRYTKERAEEIAKTLSISRLDAKRLLEEGGELIARDFPTISSLLSRLDIPFESSPHLD